MIPKLAYNRDWSGILFDTETESLNLHISRPWEIAWLSLKGGKVVEEREHILLWPDLKVSKKAAAITGFSYERYYDLAEDPKPILEELAETFYDEKTLLMGHNILGFDSMIMKKAFKLTNLWRGWGFINKMIDSLALSRAYHAKLEVDRDNFLSFQMKQLGKPPKGAKKSSISAMCKEFEIEFDPGKLHCALYDVGRNLEIFNELIYKKDL